MLKVFVWTKKKLTGFSKSFLNRDFICFKFKARKQRDMENQKKKEIEEQAKREEEEKLKQNVRIFFFNLKVGMNIFYLNFLKEIINRKAELKKKFESEVIDASTPNTIKLLFKLPCGRRIERIFLKNDPVKVLRSIFSRQNFLKKYFL